MTMTLIQTVTLGTAAASIEFTSIPQTFTDLLVLSSCRTVGSFANADIGIIRPTNNFRHLTGNNGAVGSANITSYVFIGATTAALATANTFGNSSCYIPNYTSSNAKVFSTDGVSENNGAPSEARIAASLSTDTSAITSLTISSATNLVADSTISLYGITKGSDGIVTVAFS
jgi:hypothetical protein